MLHTPVAGFEPSRRVGTDRLIRHHERRKWQPINMSRIDVGTDERALRLGQGLQRRSGRPLTLSRQAWRCSRRRKRSRAAQNGRCGPEGQGAGMGSLWAPRGRPRPYRRRIGPNRGGGACACVSQGAQEGGRHGGPLGSPRAIYTGVAGTARARPVPHAIGRPG